MAKKNVNVENVVKNEEVETPKTEDLMVNTSNGALLNVRSTPEIVPSNIIGTLKSGDKVKVISNDNRDFSQIEYNGCKAYVMSKKLVRV